MEEIVIVGVRTRLEDPKEALAQVQSFARSRRGWAQLLDAAHVMGKDHLRSAYDHARRAIEQGTQTTNSIELEVLLYASGEHQIARAINRIGVKPRRPFVLVLDGGVRPEEVLGKFRWTRDDDVLRPSMRKLRALGFSAKEIETAGGMATDLVLELVARVDLLK
ncbi:MAG TPA: KEOPS complex subunit Cgi121 [Thermoplasmata archaeon]